MREIFAALAFLAAIFAEPTASQATTVHIEYTGTIEGMFDPAGLSGFSPGDPITGSMTIYWKDSFAYHFGNSFSETMVFPGRGNATVNTFEISGPHIPGPNAFLSNQLYYPTPYHNETWEFTVTNYIFGTGVGDSDTGTETSVRFLRRSIAPIIWPVEANIAGLQSLLDAGLVSVDGTLDRSGPEGSWIVGFASDPTRVSLTSVSPTIAPVPAALPLFASAIGCLGIFGLFRISATQRLPTGQNGDCPSRASAG